VEAGSINPAEYRSKNLDHLGIVAEVCCEIGLAEEIDRVLGVDPRQKVTRGEKTGYGYGTVHSIQSGM
jgi:hypothetical protein